MLYILQTIIKQSGIHPLDEISSAIRKISQVNVSLKSKRTSKRKEKKFEEKEGFSSLEKELLTEEIKKASSQINRKKSKSKNKAETLDDSVETEEESTSKNIEEELLGLENIDYSLLEKQFVIDKSFYGAKDESYIGFAAKVIEEVYESTKKEVEEYALSNAETMDDKEAEDTVEEILSQATLGIDDIDLTTKRRFNNWQMFNKTLLLLYHSLNPIRTDDVNYSFGVI